MQVKLIDYAQQPLEKLYAAFRTCYSSDTPIEVWEKIKSEKITHEKIREFITERLKTGHASPLEQIVFWFGIANVSRSLSHQFVRHRIGISFEQQSQRYVKFKQDKLAFVLPDSWSRAGLEDEFSELLSKTSELYAKALKAGIPAEDARFVLPNAAPTNFHVMVNFAEMLHICDLRLCVRAQWEIRRMVAMMRAEIKHVLPEIAVFLQPKCGENRMGYCDESLDEYQKCPLSKVRPHKSAPVRSLRALRLAQSAGAGRGRISRSRGKRAALDFPKVPRESNDSPSIDRRRDRGIQSRRVFRSGRDVRNRVALGR